MFKSYLKIALRNLRRYKGYTFINIAGLTVGMACCALMLLFIRQELSYDRFHQKAARIYRMTMNMTHDGNQHTGSVMAAPIGPALAEEFPEIRQAVRLQTPYNSTPVKYQNQQFYEKELYYADPTIFEIFDFPLQQGDAATALQNPNSVVLSPAAAQKYFGEENPLGKILQIERGEREFQVTGVLQTIPQTSHVRPDFLIPFNNLRPQQLSNWWMFSYPTYVLLEEKASAANVITKLPAFVKRHYSDAPQGFAGLELSMQPLTDIHLHSDFNDNTGKLGAMTYIYLFAALAALIIAIACINFMNLATARSQHRSREVGVRKVVGGRRGQLVLQFLAESIMLAFFAVIGAAVVLEFFLPVFNEVAQKNLQIDYAADWSLIAGFIALALTVGIAAGSYPAFFLSRFQPVEVLKGGSGTGTTGSRLRQLLVVGQFVISIVLIVSTFIVNDQIEFIRNKRLGFDKEQVIVVPLRGEHAQNNWPVLKNELLRHPEFLQISASSAVPANEGWWRTGSRRGDSDVEGDVYTYQIDYDFFTTLGIELAAGRLLSPAFPSDSAQAFILNETAVKEFGWESAEAAIGQSFVWLGAGPENAKEGAVVGVVKDFHFLPLYEEIAPAVFHLMPWGSSWLVARVRSNSMEQALAILKTQWQVFDPQHPLEFSFMDERVEAQYGAETRLLQIFGIFSAFAIFISCLGLFGLASFTTEQRTKEIGVRKVLGASVSNIIFMLSNGFTRLVLISFVIAAPAAWWAMNQWLQNFAYRQPLGLGVFIYAGVLALGIAWLTVSYQSLKA
ncbi:MAG: ABC transporter permease, partial [candidate division KSB1 bacterium]